MFFRRILLLGFRLRELRFILLLGILAGTIDLHACSIIYYVDSATGKIYVANNEDYWYDAKAFQNLSIAW